MDIEQALRKTLFAIPSINGGVLLERMLPTLRLPPDLVVVLDQGSTDSTESVCRSAGVQLVQLGRPHTYTEACNLAATMAADRGADFVYVANNDITFQTDVARQLLAAMLRDPKLAICAPSQRLFDAAADAWRVAYRVGWDLEQPNFLHEFAPPIGHPTRCESDFCELTCAIVRLDVIGEIGFLDDAYGFYFEDADFGFRLREAGYSAAYISDAQIDHYTSSTFTQDREEQKLAFLAKNKRLFQDKHLGYGVAHQNHNASGASSWEIINRNLHHTLRRWGLIDAGRPELIFSHPGAAPFDYLYTVWETTQLPREWLAYRDRYQSVMVASRWNQRVFANAGFMDVRYVPLGVNTDIFMPEGICDRPYAETTFLWFARNQYRKGLDVMLQAWAEFRRRDATARLIVLGLFVRGSIGHAPASVRRWKNLIIEDYPDEGISVWEMLTPYTDEELAMLYRSVDFVVSNARSEGFGLVVAESMACGTLPIFAGYGASEEFAFDGALMLRGTEAKADYVDKGFDDVGNWWEPDVSHLTQLLHQSCAMDPVTRRALSERARRKITADYTWRNTACGILRALKDIQQPMAATSRRRDRFAPPSPVGSTLAWLKQTIGKPRVDGGGAGLEWLPRPSLYDRAGVLCVGYVEAALGLGQAFRDMLTSLRDMSIPFGIYPFNVNVETRWIGPFMADRYDTRGRYDINLIQTAVDQLPYAMSKLGQQRTADKYNILSTFWELPLAPHEWRATLRGIQEIWVPNDFVAEAFKNVFDGTITTVPVAVRIDRTLTFNRSHFKLDNKRFYFLFTFDYFSWPARKNPLGVLRAFRAAFPATADHVGLIIKSVGPKDHSPQVRQEIAAASDSDPRIRVIDAAMSRDEVLSLIECADCYVSLHRSEGFGLGMAEAMLLGRPVIGTDYSGSTQFLSDDTGFPVPCSLVPVQPGEYAFTEGQCWAEPDQGAAAKLMQMVVANQAERVRRTENAREFVRTHYGPEAVGAAVEGRLSEILAELKKRPQV